MIVPRSRLLFWFAAIVLPFALIGAVEPAFAAVSFLLIGLLVVVAAVDAIGARKSLAGISIELPPVARMSKDRDAKLEVRIRNEAQLRRPLRVALPLPREIPAESEELDVMLPAESVWSRLTWTCRPVRRGNFPLTSAYLEGNSP